MTLLATVGETLLACEDQLLAGEEPRSVSTTLRDTSVLRGDRGGDLIGDSLMTEDSSLGNIIIMDGSLSLPGVMNPSVTDGASRRGEPKLLSAVVVGIIIRR